jgi:S1-C subfamily serine protease
MFSGQPSNPTRSRGHRWPWGLAAVGTAGVLLAGAGTLLLGVQDKATPDNGDETAVADRAPLPLPAAERTMAQGTGAGVTDSTEQAALADQLRPSLLLIDTPDGPASGVVVGDDGIALTSAGVVGDREELTVTLANGTEVDADVVGIDTLTAIAVLDLGTDPPGARGIDPDQLAVDEDVLVMAASESGTPAVTMGSYSGPHHWLERDGQPPLEGLLQVDRAAPAASRGGPLVDGNGAVVGITVWSSGDATYATPIDVATKVANDVIETGAAQHGWMGIQGYDAADPPTAELAEGEGFDAGGGPSPMMDDGGTAEGGSEGTGESVSPDAAPVATSGVVVDVVDADGPALDELQAGDVIVAIGDRPVADMGELTATLRLFSPGDTVRITVQRPSGPATVEITLGRRSVDTDDD